MSVTLMEEQFEVLPATVSNNYEYNFSMTGDNKECLELVDGKQKEVDRVISSLHFRDDERLLLACKCCFDLKPPIINELDQSAQCKCCDTIEKSVLLRRALQHSQKGDNLVEYKLIRKYRSFSTIEHCRNILGFQWETCPCGEQCRFAHNTLENKIWQWMKDNNLEWNTFIGHISQQFTRSNADIGKFHCPICSLNLESRRQFSYHCDTREHKQLLETINWKNWMHRPLPFFVPPTQNFHLCPLMQRDNHCEEGDQCLNAHSPEEREEWNERLKLLEAKLKYAKEKDLVPFADKISSEYDETDSPASVLISDLEGVECSFSSATTKLRCVKNADLCWSIKLNCTKASKGKLSHVAFLQRSVEGCFKVSCVRGKKNSAFTSHVDFTAATGGLNNLSEGRAKFKVKFTAPDIGSFRDVLVIEFRDQPRPALMIQFHVQVTDSSEFNLLENAVESKPITVATDNWENSRKIVRYEQENLTEFDQVVMTFCQRYKPPAASLECNETNRESFDFQSDKLNVDNYVDAMHDFLYTEEAARTEAISKLRTSCDVALSDCYFSDHRGLCRTHGEQKLFGIFEIPTFLNRDTDGGLLVLENCEMVLLCRTAFPQLEVYEARIEELNSDHVILIISAECVREWKLETGKKVSCEIRFQLNRQVLCFCHQALDLLGSRVSLICPDANFAAHDSPTSPTNCTNSNLDEDQMKAMQHVMNAHPPLPLFALLGPFGTGKTYTIAACIKQLLMLDTDAKILICTHSNSAADLYIQNNFSDSYWNEKIMRVCYHNRKLATVPEDVRKFCLFDQNTGMFRYPTSQEIVAKKIKLVISTFSNALALGLSHTGLNEVFTHIFLDEAAQTIEAEAIIPLTLAVAGKTKVIVAGDHRQLSPKVYSKKFGSTADYTLVERIYSRYKDFSHTNAYQQGRLQVFLTNNYRCAEPILQLIAKTFYREGLLKSCSEERTIPSIDPVQFLHVQESCKQDKASGGFYNEREAETIVSVVTEVLRPAGDQEHSLNQTDIAVVAAYAAQVKLIRFYLRKNKLNQVIVERIRGIQGREFKVVILSCVHCRTSKDDITGFKSGLLADPGLLNTALTRSKVAVVAVGDAVTLCSLGACQYHWITFLKTCAEQRSLRPKNLHIDDIRSEIAKISTLNASAHEFVPGQPGSKRTPSSNQTIAQNEKISFVEEEDEAFDCERPLIADKILDDIMEKRFGVKLDKYRVTVDDEGYEYLDTVDDPNDITQKYYKHRTRVDDRPPIHEKHTLSELRGLLRDQPEQYKQCFLNVKQWHSAVAILKHPEPGLSKIELPTKRSIGRAFDKDEVVVRINPRSQRNEPGWLPRGRVVGVLDSFKDPRTRDFVCIPDLYNPTTQMCPVDGKMTKFFVLNFHKNKGNVVEKFKVNSKGTDLKKAGSIKVDRYNIREAGKFFIVRYLRWGEHWNCPLGYVYDVIEASDAEKYYAITYDVPPQHRDTVEKEARTLKDRNSSIREDFKDRFAFTIDPPQSTDLDDALSIENCKEHESCYKIGIHIADVGSVIPPNSDIDLEAKRRGETFYVPVNAKSGKKNSPMLPRSLSSDMCSLLPEQPRPAISMFFHTARPPVIGTNHTEKNIPDPQLTMIRSRLQLNYRQAEKFLRAGKISPVKGFENADEANLPQQLYQIWQFLLSLRRLRLGTAMLYQEPDFAKYREFCDEGLAHMLVEEAMVTLNACSAIFMKRKRCNFLLKCQDGPLEREWKQWASIHGYQVQYSLRLLSCLQNLQKNEKDAPDPRQIEANPSIQVEILPHVWDDINKALERHDVESALLLFCCDALQPVSSPVASSYIAVQQPAFLKLAKEVYNSKAESHSHFSLRIPFYSWCSSPIRRYSDITSQRMMISKIKSMKAKQTSDCVVLDSREEVPEDLKRTCKLIEQRRNDAKRYERGMIEFSLARQLQSQNERSYQMAVVTGVNDKEIAFSCIKFKHLRSLTALRYNDMMPNEKDPVHLETNGPQLLSASKLYRENTLTWHFKYYNVQSGPETAEKEYIAKYWNRTEVCSNKWKELVTLVSVLVKNGINFNEQQEEIKELFNNIYTSQTPIRKCPRRQENQFGPCRNPKCDPRDDKKEEGMKPKRNTTNTNCLDYMSFKTKNGIKHIRVLSLKMKPGTSILLQLHPTIHRSLLKPAVQLLCLAEDFDLCVEHHSKPVETFGANVKPTRVEANPKSVNQYAKTWLPVLRLDGVENSVKDQNSVTFAGVKIAWDADDKRRGSFLLGKKYCDERFIELDSDDFLCIRFNHVKSTTKDEYYTWVAHALITSVETSDVKEKLRLSSKGNTQDSNNVSFQLCQPVAPFALPNVTDDIRHRLATVECINLLVPQRRMANTLQRILLEHNPTSIIVSLCLGKELDVEIRDRKQRDAINEVLEMVGKEKLGSFSHALNEGQIEQACRAMKKKITLIQGPPGTGKSFLGAHLVYYFHEVNRLTNSRKKIIYCGPSNKSVDVVADYLQRCNLAFLRVFGTTLEELAYPNPFKLVMSNGSQEKPSLKLKDIALHEKIRMKSNPYHEEIRKYDTMFKRSNDDDNNYLKYRDLVNKAKAWELDKHDVIVCTSTTSGGNTLMDWHEAEESRHSKHPMNHLEYSHCIIDEAAMCSEPETLVPIVSSRADQVVLIGDHQQLQPVVLCNRAKELGLEVSMFERLKTHAGMLRNQYRMNESICDFPSTQFYNGRLKTDQTVRDRHRGVLHHPSNSSNAAIFAHIVGEEDNHGGENSKSNKIEAKAVVQILKWLHLTKSVRLENIMVLSPYTAQCKEIKRLIETERSHLARVHVDTVANSQGSERDYVILSTVRSQKYVENSSIDDTLGTLHWRRKYLGFVTDPHQINVAITRAKIGLCIVGNKNMLSHDAVTWKKLLDNYEEKGSVVDFDARDAPWAIS